MALFSPFLRAVDANGDPLSGALIYFYESGGLVAASTYTTSALSVAHANPVVADSGGLFAPIYLDPAISYRAILKTSDGQTVQDIDPFSGGTGITGTRTDSDPFTDTEYYSHAQFIYGTAEPGEMYSDLQAGEKSTEALTAAIIVPSDADNHQTSALAAYIQSDRSQPGNGGEVAGYFQAVANEDDSAVFPINTVAEDNASKTGQIMGIELDYNVNAADTEVNGINMVIVGNLPLTGDRNALAIRGVFSADSQWSNGLVTADGGIETYAVQIGAVSETLLTNRNSQPIALVSYKNDNTRYIATMIGDSTGGIAIRPGNASASVAFQPPDGSVNWFSIASTGFGYPTGMGGAVTQITSKSTAVTLNKVSGQVTTHNAALAATTSVSFTLNNSMIAATDEVSVWIVSGATADSYNLSVTAVAAGTCRIQIRNFTGGSLGEALVIGFSVKKGATA